MKRLFRIFQALPTLYTLGALLCLAQLASQAEDFTYVTNNGAISITGYRGAGSDVTIPSIITGLPVTSIGVQAFYDCRGLTSLTIPNSVTNIGSGAFSYCTGLTSVTIPDSVTTIGYAAFNACWALTSVTIPNRVTSIGDAAFYSCSALTCVTIPNSVTNIGDRAFCGTQTTITVDMDNPAYSSVEGVLFDKSTNTVIQVPGGKAGSYIIPNSVISIGDYAFTYCTGLTSVTIPDSVTSIGVEAFGSCTALTSVTIPNSVTSIRDWTFFHCSALTSVTIPYSLTRIGKGTFWGCALTSVTIPSSVTSIGDNAFAWCDTLREAYFSGSPPSFTVSPFGAYSSPIVYYLPGTAGWPPTYGGHPTALWLLPQPMILTLPPYFGLQANQFGFRVSWATNTSVAIDASTSPDGPNWLPLATNALTEGWTYFSDPEWTNHPARFYRVRSP